MKHNENNKARILIVDDHPIVRQGIAMLINREADMQVCCEASSADEAIAASQACRHDLAIVDMSLAGFSGLELIKRLRLKSPELAILMMSMHDEIVYAESALRAGAQGYLMKHAATDTILHAIRQVLQGELYVSDRMRTHMLQKTLRGNAGGTKSGNEPAPDEPGRYNRRLQDRMQNLAISSLSPNELEVLHLIGMGLGTSEIAEKLARNVKTIESYRAKIKKKLNLETGNQLVHFAITLVASQNR